MIAQGLNPSPFEDFNPYPPGFEGFFIGVMIFSLVNLVFIIWAVIDAAIKPDSAWRDADQSKIVWILVAIFVPIAGSLIYLLVIRPKVKAAMLNPPTPPPMGLPSSGMPPPP